VATRFTLSRRVREVTCTIPYSQTTSTKIFTLPDDARLIDFIVNVKTAVAGGTTTLDVGTNSDGDYFIDGVSVSSTGKASPTIAVPGYLTTVPTFEVYASMGAGNTSGSVDLTLIFSYAKDTPL